MRLAWFFLTRAGYINFGVAPDVASRRMPRGMEFTPRSVVVIGAGLAGKLLVIFCLASDQLPVSFWLPSG